MHAWLRALPKCELHVHLDGSLRPETVRDLADRLPPEGQFPDGFDPCAEVARPLEGTLESYLEAFDITVRLMQEATSLERIAYELCEDAARENIMYIEVRFAPLLHTEGGLKPRDVVTAVLAGLQQAEEDLAIHTGLILCALKQESTERSMEVAQLAAQFAGKGVVAFDLAGPEKHHPAQIHRAAVGFVHAASVHLTLHAGESCCPEQIRESLDLGAERIGHGTHAYEDPVVEERLRESGIPLEVCPTSNLQTSACIRDYGEHPIKRYLDLGIPVTLNTDNRLMSNVNLTDEYVHVVDAFSLDRQAALRIARNSVEAAFCEDDIKQRLHERLDAFATA